MGMFDSVFADCPRCGNQTEFQSKKGPCCLDRYTVENAPATVLLDVMNEPHWCAKCQSWFALIDPKYPPGKQPKPDLRAAAVREPKEGEYWANTHNPERHRFWDSSFTFADLASADTRPEGGDATEIAAPFTSGAVGEAETPKVSR